MQNPEPIENDSSPTEDNLAFLDVTESEPIESNNSQPEHHSTTLDIEEEPAENDNGQTDSTHFQVEEHAENDNGQTDSTHFQVEVRELNEEEEAIDNGNNTNVPEDESTSLDIKEPDEEEETIDIGNNTNVLEDDSTSLDIKGQYVVLDGEPDEDVFICRRCNKVFKSLPDYLKHKIEEENFRINIKKSGPGGKKLSLPTLVQRKKRQVKVKKESPKSKKRKRQEDEEDQDTADLKVTEGKEIEIKQEIIDDTTTIQHKCSECEKTFKREASLRNHIQREHKKEEESDGEDYDDDDDEMTYRPKTRSKDKDFLGIVVGLPKYKIKGVKQALRDKIKGNDTDRPFSCNVCGKTFKEMTVLKAHGVVHSDQREFVCEEPNCPYGFKTKGCLKRHMRRHTGERPFQCHKCNRAFSESGALKRHQKAIKDCSLSKDSQFSRYGKAWTYHPNIPAVLDASLRDPTRGPNSLPKTKQEVSYMTDWSLKGGDMSVPEEVKEGGEEEEEDGVKVIGADVEVGEEDMMEEEDGEMTELQLVTEAQEMTHTQCQVCKKDLFSEEALELHLKMHIADKSACCGLCHFISKDKEELRLHILTLHHDSLKDIEASVLAGSVGGEEGKDQRTSLRESLTAVKQLYNLKRERGVVGERVIEMSTAGSATCMVCDKTFRGASYLRQHMRMHTGDRPFVCSEPGCSQRFTSRDVLKKHMFVHSDTKQFKCGECGKMFKRLAHVQQHLRSHATEKNFQCAVCDKRLKSSNSLKVHMRVHYGIKPYYCAACGRHFRERGSLERHQRLHTGAKPFVCPHCCRGFAESGTLSRHLRSKVPCTPSRGEVKGQEGSVGQAGTVLTQFSNMVADTQQYILPQLQEEDQTEEFIVENIEVITDVGEQVHNVQQMVPLDGLAVDEVTEQLEAGDDDTETLQIFDSSTGESVVIVAEKSIVDLVRGQDLTFDSQQGETSLQKIKELIIAAGEGRVTATTHNELEIKEMFIGSKGITEASEEVTEVIETGEEVSGQEVTEGHSVDLTVVPDE